MIQHPRPCASQHQPYPAQSLGREAHALQALHEPAPIHPIIRLLKIQKQNTARLLLCAAIVYFFQVLQHIIPNPSARQEGCLPRVHHCLCCRRQPLHQHPSHQLVITVQQGDGPVAIDIIQRLATPPLCE